MTLKQKAKHIADRQPQPYTEPFTGPTPDELGKWQGGLKKSAPNWVGLKSRPTQTGDFKNTPGKVSNGVVERSSDYFKQGNNPVLILDKEDEELLAYSMRGLATMGVDETSPLEEIRPDCELLSSPESVIMSDEELLLSEADILPEEAQ